MLVSNNAKLIFRMFELEKESFVVLPDKDHFDCLRFAADLYVHFAANGKRWLLEGQAFQPGLDLIRQQNVGLCGNSGMIRVREGENYRVQYEIKPIRIAVKFIISSGEVVERNGGN